jgi:hypothetical protein
MFSVGKRIGLGYLLMAVLLVGIGLAGLLAVDRINAALNRVTGPVDATARAVGKGIRGMLLQMIGVDAARPARAGRRIAPDGPTQQRKSEPLEPSAGGNGADRERYAGDDARGVACR